MSDNETSHLHRGALSGIRVLDLSRVLAGPWSSQNLADLGADVIKVERPGAGDDTRSWGPPYHRLANEKELSAYFISANRGKRSITVDINLPEGQTIVRELARQSDILIENFKVDDLARRGLDYESLNAINPALIYCSITGFGQTGPYRERPGYDFMIQAMGGLMSVTGVPEGEPGAGPAKVGVALADIMTGLYATIGILAALHSRNDSGKGQYIDMALLDVQVATLANQGLNYLVSGAVPERLGNAHPNIVPYQSFASSDGHLIIAVGNDAQFARLCEVIGRVDIRDDSNYSTNGLRVAHRDALVTEIQSAISMQSTAHWLDALAGAGVPSGPINRLDEVFADPQVAARHLQLSLNKDGVDVPTIASPLNLSATPVGYDLAPPLLGEHTADILSELLGYPVERIEFLKQSGVI